jgi:hypothetical protein
MEFELKLPPPPPPIAVKLRKEQAASEQELAGATATTTAATKENTAEVEKQAAARQRAHEQRIKQLRQESAEFLKTQNATLKKVGQRDAFGGQPTDVSKQVTPERLSMIQNASASILNMNKQIAATMPGIIIPEDAVLRLNAATEAQKQMRDPELKRRGLSKLFALRQFRNLPKYMFDDAKPVIAEMRRMGLVCLNSHKVNRKLKGA